MPTARIWRKFGRWMQRCGCLRVRKGNTPGSRFVELEDSDLRRDCAGAGLIVIGEHNSHFVPSRIHIQLCANAGSVATMTNDLHTVDGFNEKAITIEFIGSRLDWHVAREHASFGFRTHQLVATEGQPKLEHVPDR